MRHRRRGAGFVPGLCWVCAGLVTGLSSKPVTMQTVYIQRDNANSDGLKGFSGKKLRNAHAREAMPAQISSKRFRSIFGIMYF